MSSLIVMLRAEEIHAKEKGKIEGQRYSTGVVVYGLVRNAEVGSISNSVRSGMLLRHFRPRPPSFSTPSSQLAVNVWNLLECLPYACPSFSASKSVRTGATEPCFYRSQHRSSEVTSLMRKAHDIRRSSESDRLFPPHMFLLYPSRIFQSIYIP